MICDWNSFCFVRQKHKCYFTAFPVVLMELNPELIFSRAKISAGIEVVMEDVFAFNNLKTCKFLYCCGGERPQKVCMIIKLVFRLFIFSRLYIIYPMKHQN